MKLNQYREYRNKWYYWVQNRGKTVTEVCSFYGISRKTYYYWYNRDFKEKEKLNYISRSNLQPNLKFKDEIKGYVRSLKLKYNYGPLKLKILIKKEFKVDISTTVIYRYLKRNNLIRKKQRKIKNPFFKPIKNRIKPLAPGGLVQLDIKYVWRKGRYYYQRTFLDVYSRKQFIHLSKEKDSFTTIFAFELAQGYFNFKITALQTDNGSEFRGRFHSFLRNNGILHFFIPKGNPQWNGIVERAHKSIDDEFYHFPQRVFRNYLEYLEWYNNERPHLGINGLTPNEKVLEWEKKKEKSVTLGC